MLFITKQAVLKERWGSVFVRVSVKKVENAYCNVLRNPFLIIRFLTYIVGGGMPIQFSPYFSNIFNLGQVVLDLARRRSYICLEQPSLGSSFREK